MKNKFTWLVTAFVGLVVGWLESLFLCCWALPVFFIVIVWWWQGEEGKRAYWLAFLLGLWRDLLRGGGLGKSASIFLILVFLLQNFGHGLRRSKRFLS